MFWFWAMRRRAVTKIPQEVGDPAVVIVRLTAVKIDFRFSLPLILTGNGNRWMIDDDKGTIDISIGSGTRVILYF